MGDLDYEESWALKNWCSWTVVLGKILRVPWSARRSNQSIRKSVLNIHRKDWCWSWSSSSLVTWCEELIHWKWPWCWERLKAGGEGDDRGWDGWMASPTPRTWVWTHSGKSWRAGKAWRAVVRGATESWTQLSDWKTATTLWAPEHPGWHGSKESTSKRSEFDPCVGKIPWRRKWQPTPVF